MTNLFCCDVNLLRQGIASLCELTGTTTKNASLIAASSISVGTSEPGIQHNLLETFAVLPLEIAYERIVSFPFGETIYFKTF